MVQGKKIISKILKQTLNKDCEILKTNFTNQELINYRIKITEPKYIVNFIYDKNEKINQLCVFDIFSSKLIFNICAEEISNTFDEVFKGDTVDVSSSELANLKETLNNSNESSKLKEAFLKLWIINNLS